MNTIPAGSFESAEKTSDVDMGDSALPAVNLSAGGVVSVNNENIKSNNSGNLTGNFNATEVDFNNKYKLTDKGPFFVFVEHEDKNLGKLFPMRVGYYLRLDNEYKKSILDIKIVGRNRVKVILDNFRSANSMIGNELLTKNGLIAYVPKFYTQKRGVVRMVDTYFSDEYLLQNIECDRKVMEVKRMERKITDSEGKEKVVKRQMIVVSFQGNLLPQKIRINGVNFPVDPYVHPVIQCYRCLRYGHVTKLCKNTESVCKKCSLVHSEGECSNEVRCLYCNTNSHPSMSRQCPVYLKQKRIKERMAHQNLSFKEAEAMENNPSYAKVVTNNRFQILNNLENFPALSNNVNNTSNYASISKPKTSQPRRPSNSSPSHIKSTFPSKKRKTVDPLSPGTPNNSSPAYPIIPNPFAQDFRDYKQVLANKLVSFFEDLVSRLGVQDSLSSLNIKKDIDRFLADVGDGRCDDVCGIENDDGSDTSY